MLISIASPKDIDDIMFFIHNNWKKNHILSRNKSFFIYEHQNNDKINFIIAKNESKIIGVLGFISTSITDLSNVFTVIWKVKENNENPVLGIQLLKFLENVKGVNTIFSVGINKNILKIFEHLNIYTNKLDQYVLVNQQIKNYKIAHINNPKKKSIISNNYTNSFYVKKINSEKELNSFDFLKYKLNLPYKSKEYFIKRYFNHPIYNYIIYGIYKDEDLISLYVNRLQEYNNSNVIRIIDFIGDEITIYPFARFISKLIINKGYEYADFYCFGLNKEIIINAGFEIVSFEDNELIIPNYFEPFIKKNIPIYFFAKTKKIEKVNLFKGDGDQDRPS